MDRAPDNHDDQAMLASYGRLHAIEPRTDVQDNATQQGLETQSELARWSQIRLNGNLSLELAEAIDECLSRIAYGKITLDIERGQVSGMRDEQSRKFKCKHR
jgi:hypothetical protein